MVEKHGKIGEDRIIFSQNEYKILPKYVFFLCPKKLEKGKNKSFYAQCRCDGYMDCKDRKINSESMLTGESVPITKVALPEMDDDVTQTFSFKEVC